MESEPVISVIVPVYNVEKYLKKCLDSIVNQTYQDLEIILVDDGSTDTSGIICDQYAKKDSRIKVVHQENKGQSSARNSGLEIAKGNYIAFVDSDDTIETNMFEILMEMQEITECDLAICGHRTVQEGASFITSDESFSTELLDIEALWEEVFGKLNNAVWNKLFKKDLLVGIRFSLELTHGEDLIFNLEYLIRCKAGAINRQPCYNYLKRCDSVTTSSFSKKKLMEIESKDRALEIVKKYKISQISNAEKYCFRARMNVMRVIIKAGLEKQYMDVVSVCRKYVRNYYVNVKTELRRKERLEYFLNIMAFGIYKVVVRRFW